MNKMAKTNTPHKCAEEKKMDKELLCSACREYVDTNKKDFSPNNILFCGVFKHKKPDWRKIDKQMRNFLPGYDYQKLFGEKASGAVNATAIQSSNMARKPPTERRQGLRPKRQKV